MCFGSTNAGAVNALQQQQQQDLQSGSAAIQKAYAGFTPQFYQGVQTAYQNQALPQLDTQYRQAGQAANYKLANQGLTQSSAAQTTGQALQEALASGQQQVVNQGQQAAQTLQQNVAGQESQLYSQLANSLNPTATAQQAASLAGQTAAPSVFQPLGQMFQNFANTYLANNNANTSNATAQWLYPYLINQGNSASSGYLPTNP